MKKRYAIQILWVLSSALLFFFESSPGTCTILAASLLLPPLARCLPSRLGLLSPPPSGPLEREEKELLPGPSDALSELRPYVPGDPVRHIHWKMTARTGQVLVRIPGPSENDPVPVSGKKESTGQVSPSRFIPRRFCLLLAGGLLFLLFLLLFPARESTLSLLNRLFDMSESRNAYVYDHFPVASAPGPLPSFILLILFSAIWCLFLFTVRSPWLNLLTAALLSVLQAYLGLPLPGAVNVLLYALLGLPLLRLSRRGLSCAAALILVFFLICLLFQGAFAPVEQASEQVRDLLSLTLEPSSLSRELQGVLKGRHVHDRSLLPGDGGAGEGQAFHLVLLTEKQISRPPWMDWGKTVLLLLGSLAVILLPFLPVILMESKRQKRQALRLLWQDMEPRQAVQAAFPRVVSCLDAAGFSQGNLLFRAWEEGLQVSLSPEYAADFGTCAEIYEKAVYSDGALLKEERDRVLALYDDTLALMKTRCTFPARIRLELLA